MPTPAQQALQAASSLRAAKATLCTPLYLMSLLWDTSERSKVQTISPELGGFTLNPTAHPASLELSRSLSSCLSPDNLDLLLLCPVLSRANTTATLKETVHLLQGVPLGV